MKAANFLTSWVFSSPGWTFFTLSIYPYVMVLSPLTGLWCCLHSVHILELNTALWIGSGLYGGERECDVLHPGFSITKPVSDYIRFCFVLFWFSINAMVGSYQPLLMKCPNLFPQCFSQVIPFFFQFGVMFIDTNNISLIFLQKNIYLNLKIFKVLFPLILTATLQALLQLRESSSLGDTWHETRTQNSQIFPPFRPSVL